MTQETRIKPALPDQFNLTGRKVFVAGAASGIGRATARCFGRLGADLILSDRSNLDSVLEEVKSVGGSATLLQGDLADDGYLNEIIAGGPYYSFAYVAGVFRAGEGATSRESFEFVMRVNVHAPLILGGALIDKAKPEDGGYMVFVGSSAGRSGKGKIGTPDEYATYAASKGAIHTLVRALAYRGAEKNILVNGIAPGVVRTAMLDSTSPKLATNPAVSALGRSADPEELAWPIAFLCSPAASFISGAILDVNGGSFIA